MHFRLALLLLTLASVSFAQDTNFAAGPQYLMTTGSPMLFHSISTPSLSFSSAITDPYAGSTELAPSHISSSMAAIGSNTSLGEVYWGEHSPTEIVARHVETPSLTPDQTALYTYGTANLASTPMPEPPTVPVEAQQNSSVIEITWSQLPPNLPASIFDAGVTATADSQSLVARGVGVSLGDFARQLKSRKHLAKRVFTNEDLQRR